MKWQLFLTFIVISGVHEKAMPIEDKTQEISDDAGEIKVTGSGKIKNGKISLDVHFEIDAGLPGMGTGAPVRPATGSNIGVPGTGSTTGVPGTGSSIGTPGTGSNIGTSKTGSNIGTPGTGSTIGTPGTGSNIGLPGTGVFSQEEISALNEHNRFRATHNAPPMKLNRALCDAAAQWAKVIAEKGDLIHTTDAERPNQGENLSKGCSSDKAQTVEEAVADWYNEVCYPGYYGLGQVETGPDEAGHFSQVVWKRSVELGIGRAEIEEGGMKCGYIVGRYSPQGNVIGEYKGNVLLGTFARDMYCPSVKKPDQNGRKKEENFASQTSEQTTDKKHIKGPLIVIMKRGRKTTGENQQSKLPNNETIKYN